jgi:sugar phosphate permease
MLPLVQVMVSTVGWRSTWLIMGIAAMAILVPVNGLLFRGKPEDMGLRPDGEPTPSADVADAGGPVAEETAWTLALAVRTPAFWLVLFANNLAGAGTIGILVNQVAYLKENFSDSVAVTAATLITATSLGARFFWLVIADRIHPRYSASTTFLLAGLGMLSLIYATNIPVLVLWMIFFGLAISGMEPLTSMVWATYFGRSFLGSIRGFVTLANAVSYAGSPLLAAAIADATGDYRIAFLIYLVGFLMATLLMLFARPPRTPRAQQLPPIEARG